MKPYQDLSGVRFGRLVVKSRGWHEKTNTAEWLCLCDCGAEKVVPAGSLRQGKVKSCGCLRKTPDVPMDLVGKKCGRLTVLSFHSRASNRVAKWNCRCECGKEVVVRRSNLWLGTGNREEKTFSCGCQKSQNVAVAHRTHGETKHGEQQTKEYSCWQNILQRCYNEKHSHYRWYGAKGVTVCKQWRTNFRQFLKDAGRAPYSEAHIDRIDPYGNYEPGNVRWVSPQVSAQNKR